MGLSAEPPFGAYAPAGGQAALIRLTRRLPPGWLGTRAAFVVRKLALRRLTHPLDVEVYGQRMRLHPRNNLCEKKVLFTPRIYDRAERAALAEGMGPASTFLDIGANVGIYSLFVAGLAGARIVAVEPDPEIFDRLRFNIAANGLARRIRAERVAIAGQAGRLRFEVNRQNRGESRLAATGKIEVEAIPLLDLMARHGIERADAMKIDIEGAEFQVLDRFFATAPPARWPELIVMEWIHDHPIRNAVALVRAKGYAPVVRTKLNLVLKRVQPAAK